NRDPNFAKRFLRAQQERDRFYVSQIQKAGNTSWRAAAWLLERNEPGEYSLGHKSRGPWSARRQRRLKKLITETLNNLAADRPANERRSTLERFRELIEDRLADINSHDQFDDDT